MWLVLSNSEDTVITEKNIFEKRKIANRLNVEGVLVILKKINAPILSM